MPQLVLSQQVLTFFWKILHSMIGWKLTGMIAVYWLIFKAIMFFKLFTAGRLFLLLIIALLILCNERISLHIVQS